MALNLKNALETVKRAGFGAEERSMSGKSERRMADAERTDPIRAADAEPREEALEHACLQAIEYHSHPEMMTSAQLFDIDDL